MSFNRAQRKSETFRYGDTNEEHELGVQKTLEYLHSRDFICRAPFPTQFSQTFLAWNTNKGLTFDKWNLDIAAWSSKVVQADPTYIIEVDGEKHDKIRARINDGIVKEWVKFKYPNTFFVRLSKTDDCLWPDRLKRKLGI